jgi:hypothetical protein
MSARNKKASFGVFPHEREFKSHVSSDRASLSYRLGDIDRGEVFVSHNSHSVTMKIIPSCKGYVIECPYFISEGSEMVTPKLFDHLERYQDLKWDTATGSELASYFKDSIETLSGFDEYWIGRSMQMVTPIIEACCELRDEHGYPFTENDIRTYMPLDAYEKLSQYVLLSPHTRSVLAAYVSQFEKVVGEDGVSTWSLPSRTQHGYCTMQIAASLTTGYKEGGRRDYRLAPAVIHFAVEKPIVSFTYDISKDDVFIHAYFIDKPAVLDI